jgi:arabinogalactan oligomer/maltooligosaccharide transport system substrate-binding protein
MKVVNKFTVVAVAAATLLALAGCGGSGDKGNAQSGIAGATANLNKLDLGTVTLNVWAPQQNLQPGPNGKTHIKQIEADFQKAHPGVKFKNAVVGEADAGKTVGQDPTAAADVYMYANDQLGALIKANGVGAQTNADIINSVKIQNSSVMLDSITQDGKIYGVPYTGNTWFMYYNNSMLNKNDVKSLDTMLSKAKIAFPLANSWYFPAFYLGAGGTLYGSKGTDASAGVEFNKPDVTKYLVNLAKNPNYDISTPGLAGDDAGLKGLRGRQGRRVLLRHMGRFCHQRQARRQDERRTAADLYHERQGKPDEVLRWLQGRRLEPLSQDPRRQHQGRTTEGRTGLRSLPRRHSVTTLHVRGLRPDPL